MTALLLAGLALMAQAPAPSGAPPAAPATEAPAPAAAAMRGEGDLPDLTAPSEPPAEDLSLGWTLVRTLLLLGIVVALIYLSLNFGLRKLMGLRGPPTGGMSLVTLLERLPLDQKRALFVVKAAGDYLLIGGGEQELALIAKLNPEEVERLVRERPSPAVTLSPFLQKLLTKRGGPPPSA